MSNRLLIELGSIGVILCPVVVGIIQFNKLDTAARILWAYVSLGFAVEGLALYAAYKFKNNMPVYGIYSLFEFGLTCLYFNYSVDSLRKYSLGYIIGATGVILGVANSYFLQPLKGMNSYFIYFEGITIIALSLFSFFRILLLSEELRVFKLRQFWFPTILCFYWSFNFFNWGMYEYFAINAREWMWLFNIAIRVVGAITYISIAIVFWQYSKLKDINE